MSMKANPNPSSAANGACAPSAKPIGIENGDG